MRRRHVLQCPRYRHVLHVRHRLHDRHLRHLRHCAHYRPTTRRPRPMHPPRRRQPDHRDDAPASRACPGPHRPSLRRGGRALPVSRPAGARLVGRDVRRASGRAVSWGARQLRLPQLLRVPCLQGTLRSRMRPRPTPRHDARGWSPGRPTYCDRARCVRAWAPSPVPARAPVSARSVLRCWWVRGRPPWSHCSCRPGEPPHRLGRRWVRPWPLGHHRARRPRSGGRCCRTSCAPLTPSPRPEPGWRRGRCAVVGPAADGADDDPGNSRSWWGLYGPSLVFHSGSAWTTCKDPVRVQQTTLRMLASCD